MVVRCMRDMKSSAACSLTSLACSGKNSGWDTACSEAGVVGLSRAEIEAKAT